MRLRWVLFWSLATCVLLVPPAAASHQVPAVRAGMLRASDLLLNLELDAAAAECQRLLVVPQGEATGRFCLSLVTLTRAEDQDDPTSELDRFLGQAAEALAAAEAQERAAPTDAETQLLLGLIHGSKALVDGGRRNYFSALQGVREAHRRFQEAQRLDPALVDAVYGLGLYHIALDRLPLVVRPFAALVLPSGDAALGLRELERVGEQGAYLKMTARVALLHLYAGTEHRYAEAVRVGAGTAAAIPGEPGPVLRDRPCGVRIGSVRGGAGDRARRWAAGDRRPTAFRGALGEVSSVDGQGVHGSGRLRRGA